MFENGDGGGASVVHQSLSSSHRAGQHTDLGQVRGNIVFTFTQIGFRRLSTSGDMRISARTLSIITLLAIVLIGAIGWGSRTQG